MLKWENKNDAYGNYFSADTGIGGEYVIQLYTDEVIGLLDEHAELFYIAASTVDEVKVACEADYARRVTKIAAANGYVKLEPGQVVVQVEDLTRIVTWFKGDARTVPHADMDTTLNRFAAALDAAKGEWK